MPISKELLEILCCPLTKTPVKMLPPDILRTVNDMTAKRALRDVDGNVVEKPLAEALITVDNKTIYRIDEDIPVMLIGSGIPAKQIPGF